MFDRTLISYVVVERGSLVHLCLCIVCMTERYAYKLLF